MLPTAANLMMYDLTNYFPGTKIEISFALELIKECEVSSDIRRREFGVYKVVHSKGTIEGLFGGTYDLHFICLISDRLIPVGHVMWSIGGVVSISISPMLKWENTTKDGVEVIQTISTNPAHFHSALEIQPDKKAIDEFIEAVIARSEAALENHYKGLNSIS